MQELKVGDRVRVEGAGLAILDDLWDGVDSAGGTIRRVDSRYPLVTVTLDAAYGGLTVVLPSARVRAETAVALPPRKPGLLRLIWRAARVRV